VTIRGPFGFSGGLNTKASSWTLPPDSLSASQNVNLLYKDLVKRNGCATINSSVLNSGAVVTGIFDWLINSGTRYLIVVAGSKIFNSATLSSTFTDISGSATIVAGGNNLHTFDSLNNIVLICGGTTPDTPLQWTGTGNVASLSGSPPIGNIVCVSNNIAFISGVAANPSKVYWSNPSDPQTWPAASNIDFRASDGDSVTALIDSNQNLLIFKRRSIGFLLTQSQVVSGTVTLGPLTQVVVGVGCPGPHCATNLPDGRICFLGTDGHVYMLEGGSSPIDISNPSDGSNIQPTLDALNISRFPYASVKAYPTRNQVWISVSSLSSSTNDTILVYDYQLRVWVSIFTNLNANILEPAIDPRTVPNHSILMLTGDYMGFVYEQDKGTTDATVSGGTIDGYGTIVVQTGIDKTDFVPRSVVIPLEAQVIGQLQFGYGFNGLTDIGSSMAISESQGQAQLDNNFFIDRSLLSQAATIRAVANIGSSGRVYTMQMQFRNSESTQPFQVHPVYVSDEVIV